MKIGMYDNAFYDQITEGSLRSARKVVPKIKEIFSIESVIDFGCGTGAWLSVFKENGSDRIFGIDGDYVDRNRLLISQTEFKAIDFSQDYFIDVKCDLAVSLEVAEHLPRSDADRLIECICHAADNIVFSAAVPGQNGVGHVNEQWPSYWIPKFEAYGFTCSTNFRFEFWHDEDIENWYRQNILLFSKCDKMVDEAYMKYFAGPQVLDVIHYNNWMGKI